MNQKNKKIALLCAIIFVAMGIMSFYIFQLYKDNRVIERARTEMIIVRPHWPGETRHLTNENIYIPDTYATGSEFEYALNTEFLGVGNYGLEKLLSRLQKLNDCDIRVVNPPVVHKRSLPGSGSDSFIYSDLTYLYPVIRDREMRVRIINEIDRIRKSKSEQFPSEFFEIDPDTGEEFDRDSPD